MSTKNRDSRTGRGNSPFGCSGSGTANSIAVTNTMGNARAVENHARKLERIDVHGLLGPVTLRHYLEAELNCVAK